jgi:hypothetical protein
VRMIKAMRRDIRRERPCTRDERREDLHVVLVVG